jgi:hypothetical protein
VSIALQVEFVYVLEPRADFVATMLSAIEAYLEHRRAHLWAVRQRKVRRAATDFAP